MNSQTECGCEWDDEEYLEMMLELHIYDSYEMAKKQTEIKIKIKKKELNLDFTTFFSQKHCVMSFSTASWSFSTA